MVWKVKEVQEECLKEWAAEAATRRRVVEQVVEGAVEWIQMRQIQVSFWTSYWISSDFDLLF